ncbi:uncharacterized protein LOC121874195 [Homarus americanus]|uniref:Uncharacterized protein n=1 Tax=Homarus americanus TaxID=6706 RepID=A0A8J5MSX4_HOMAM|nr:uncharacterized protein LOC121874195 [Homarus americanus]KAG7162229.1 hypothetical protein Hamer_G010909 [Homarus americanus]
MVRLWWLWCVVAVVGDQTTTSTKIKAEDCVQFTLPDDSDTHHLPKRFDITVTIALRPEGEESWQATGTIRDDHGNSCILTFYLESVKVLCSNGADKTTILSKPVFKINEWKKFFIDMKKDSIKPPLNTKRYSSPRNKMPEATTDSAVTGGPADNTQTTTDSAVTGGPADNTQTTAESTVTRGPADNTQTTAESTVTRGPADNTQTTAESTVTRGPADNTQTTAESTVTRGPADNTQTTADSTGYEMVMGMEGHKEEISLVKDTGLTPPFNLAWDRQAKMKFYYNCLDEDCVIKDSLYSEGEAMKRIFYFRHLPTETVRKMHVNCTLLKNEALPLTFNEHDLKDANDWMEFEVLDEILSLKILVNGEEKYSIDGYDFHLVESLNVTLEGGGQLSWCGHRPHTKYDVQQDIKMVLTWVGVVLLACLETVLLVKVVRVYNEVRFLKKTRTRLAQERREHRFLPLPEELSPPVIRRFSPRDLPQSQDYLLPQTTRATPHWPHQRQDLPNSFHEPADQLLINRSSNNSLYEPADQLLTNRSSNNSLYEPADQLLISSNNSNELPTANQP